jgi:hypothetical protein
MATPPRTTTAGRVFNDLRNAANKQRRSTDELLSGAHDLDAETLTAALRRTASYRGVPLQPLSPRLGQLVTLRSGPYRTWRQRQGPDADAYPAALDDVITEITRFTDPLLAGAVHGRRWNSNSRQ